MEMIAQWVKHLFCKYESQSSNPQHLCNYLGTAVGGKTGEFSGTHCLTSLAKSSLTISVRDPLSRQQWKEQQRKILMFCSDLYMNMQRYAYLHAHMLACMCLHACLCTHTHTLYYGSKYVNHYKTHSRQLNNLVIYCILENYFVDFVGDDDCIYMQSIYIYISIHISEVYAELSGKRM